MPRKKKAPQFGPTRKVKGPQFAGQPTRKVEVPRFALRPTRNVLHLRVDEQLRQRLQQAADEHRITLVAEIRLRLGDSFTHGDVVHTVDEAARSMKVCWERYSARYLRMDLGDQLADAVVAGDDNKAKTLARLIIEHRAVEQRASSGEY
jgi:hypothetical protein